MLPCGSHQQAFGQKSWSRCKLLTTSVGLRLFLSFAQGQTLRDRYFKMLHLQSSRLFFDFTLILRSGDSGVKVPFTKDSSELIIQTSPYKQSYRYCHIRKNMKHSSRMNKPNQAKQLPLTGFPRITQSVLHTRQQTEAQDQTFIFHKFCSFSNFQIRAAVA